MSVPYFLSLYNFLRLNPTASIATSAQDDGGGAKKAWEFSYDVNR